MEWLAPVGRTLFAFPAIRNPVVNRTRSTGAGGSRAPSEPRRSFRWQGSPYQGGYKFGRNQRLAKTSSSVLQLWLGAFFIASLWG
jgi:hypothetical protein